MWLVKLNFLLVLVKMNAEKAQNEIAKIEQIEGEFRELNSWEDEKSKPAINSRLPMD